MVFINYIKVAISKILCKYLSLQYVNTKNMLNLSYLKLPICTCISLCKAPVWSDKTVFLTQSLAEMSCTLKV